MGLDSRIDALLEEIDYNASNSWLNLGDVSKVKTNNILSSKELGNLPVQDRFLSIIRRPEYIPYVTETFLNFRCHPFQSVALRELWLRAFPMFVWTRGGSKSTIFGIYAILRALLDQGSKVLLVGSSFRQAKGVFDVASNVWYNSPMLRSLVDENSRQGPRFEIDRCTLRLGESIITAIPLGNGEKVRGLRATHLIVDEFKSVPLDVVENVVFGFAAVSKSPLDNVIEYEYKEYLKRHNLWLPEMERETEKLECNQTVIGGTAYWAWNHFYHYFKRYKGFIQSQGDPKKYKAIFGVDMPDGFDHRDYCIMRLSADMLPRTFMDEKTLARNKSLMTKANARVEYDAIFELDSDGFYKRSIVEQCVVGPKNQLSYPSCGDAFFKAVLKGRYGCKYVIAADPASEIDKFAITILEVWPDHRRIVYCWTTKKSEYEAAKKRGLTTEKTFYSFCTRKLRTLLHLFSPCIRLVIDSQGGGRQIAEALNDTDKMTPGEQFIWPIKEEGVEKETDRNPGEHILEFVQFSSAEWTSEANHGLKKDFEDHVTIFPYFDAAEIEIALEMDKEAGLITMDPVTGDQVRLADTLEDCIQNIEDLKDELATIVVTQTPSGRERWDVPEKKSEGSVKGKLRKDRYSALLMANASARKIYLNPERQLIIQTVGGVAANEARKGTVQVTAQGPSWWLDKCAGFSGKVVKRG